MQLAANTFKSALSARRGQIGLWIGLPDTSSIEICAGAGFDWLMIDSEHAPNDLQSILHLLQTVAAYPVHPVVRPPAGDAVTIKRYLDLGVQTLMIPMVETAEQAQALVRAMRYPPEGIRGVGTATARAARWGGIEGYLKNAGAETCLLVQIESQQGLDHLESIAGTPGVDGVFIGPADLAAALGHLGNPAHPAVQSAIEQAIRRIDAAGKPSGILAVDETLARRYLSLGCTFVATGVDTVLLARAARELARKFKSQENTAASP